MASTWPQSNGPTTAAGETRIQQFIAAREEELNAANNLILKEEQKSRLCQMAITNLEQVIPVARQALNIHEDSLKAMTDIERRKRALSSLFAIPMQQEPTTMVLYHDFKTNALLSHGDIGAETIEACRKQIQLLQEKLRHLEMDLEGWKISQKLSRTTLEYLGASKRSAEEVIAHAKKPFKSIWKIPSEIWSSIFKIARDDEFDEYIRGNNTKTLRPMVYVLSHVCRHWRFIVYDEPSLWSLVYAPPVQAWREDERDLLAISVQKSRQPITLLCNMYQAFSKGYSPTRRSDRNSGWATTVSPTDNTELSGKQYVFHINTRADDSTYMQRLQNIPFRRPDSVVISATMPLCSGYIFAYYLFQTVKSLTITNDNPVLISPLSSTTSLMPRLTTLKFNVKQFASQFNLGKWLTGTLEELHIHHEASSYFPLSLLVIEMAKLRILGITSASYPILQCVTAPQLRVLILYGSSNPADEVKVASGTYADQAYRRITHMKFDSWREVERGNTMAGAVSMLGKLVPKTPALRSIQFRDSFVDGSPLVAIISKSTTRDESGTLNELKEITLSRINGITRSECDQIKQMVDRLNIYV